ncbi:conserved hypothetical protein [Parvibaculum lavamentivorans DS-1]|uniref:DUF3108 domain-containing protein n=1 Tax=Parvibaculum lavamentivorans (strain DS-1 / DSM 13023 / NCIMB 13966) TaxID=402881 RepID=A7HTU0_PARL1|nr:DUF3108 domain-containing protein [Parvibaculum lavamentivorans]ABS63323.1 conserved hypothetical protein [Parvibaculum lavamentivorans DS-1]
MTVTRYASGRKRHIPPGRPPFLGAALALVCGMVAIASGTAAPAPAAQTGPVPDIRADYTVYVGGLMFAEGSMHATLTDSAYLLRNSLGSAGLPSRVWDARWTMTSEGRIADDKLQPTRFTFSATEKSETKRRLMVYDASGTPELTFDPPLPPEEATTTQPFERKNTLDPVSAFLLPVIADGNPCDRKIPVFDGKRRYDLQLVFDKNDTVTTRDNGYSGEAVRCKVRVTPRAGMEPTRFTTMMRRRDDTLIWLARVDGRNIYMPVRVQLRTPIGGAVLDVVKLQQYATAEGPSENIAE